MLDVRRRDFITLLGGAAVAWPVAARAQHAGRLRRIGALIGGNASVYQGPMAKFREELQRRGWAAQNLQIDFRFATDLNQTNSSLAELVELAPDVLFTNNTPTVLAMREKTKTTPIVFVIVTDPVGSGLVSNLAHPGGNVTGFTNYEFSTSGKWLQMLKEITPGLARAAVIFNPKTAPYSSKYLGPLQDAATSLRVELIASGVADAAEIERVVSEVGQRPGGALMTLPDFSTGIHRDLIIAVAARHQVPGVYHYRYFPAAGGLMSYGIDIAEQFRQGALYVDRILRGEKPGDLPIQAPTKYELVINLKTAKALDLTIPQSLLARADEVIE
jgi:putative tryptophan/tyrosine transport system substrate-binding protein